MTESSEVRGGRGADAASREGTVEVTVLVCSTARSSSLRRTMDSLLCDANLRAADWELLVVIDLPDGASADVCREYEAAYPKHVRCLVQDGRGKSNALNVGIAQARGSILAMTDDDVLCDAGYLDAIRQVFRSADVDGAQGRVVLDCEDGFPRWFVPRFARFMSLRDFGAEMREWNDNMCGTNMVVRTSVAREVGGFSAEIGAGALGFCEDSEFSLRVRRAGHRLVYAPGILVRHQLSRSRLTKSFFRRRYFLFGASYAYYTPLTVPLWRFAAYTARRVLAKEVQALACRMLGREGDALACQCQGREELGYFWQHWRFSRGLRQGLSHATFARPAAHV